MSDYCQGSGYYEKSERMEVPFEGTQSQASVACRHRMHRITTLPVPRLLAVPSSVTALRLNLSASSAAVALSAAMTLPPNARRSAGATQGGRSRRSRGRMTRSVGRVDKSVGRLVVGWLLSVMGSVSQTGDALRTAWSVRLVGWLVGWLSS